MIVRSAAEILDELERSCVEAQEALRARDWSAANAVWIRQRTMTHELEKSLEETPLPKPERAVIDARIERIAKYRDAQLRSLKAFRDSIGAKLATMNKFKNYERVTGADRRNVPRLLDKTQ